MSDVIENRVVEFQFNNKNFEENVKTSMSTLDKLKEKLNFSGANKAFDDLQKASSKFDLSDMNKSVEEVHNNFSALEVIALTVLQRITNAALNTGKELVNALAIEPMMEGFNKYNQKVQSVATLFSTGKYDMNEIVQAMEKLEGYTDATSYGFSSLSDAMTKFTAAGVDLSDAELAMEGIGNWAASAGITAASGKVQQLTYNLSQAIGTGALLAQDWKSIEGANANTEKFNQTLIDTAVEMGTLTKVGEQFYVAGTDVEVTVTGLKNTLQKRWATSDVVIATLQKFADTTTELGRSAAAAAAEARTFEDASGAIADAVSSSWSKTMEYVLGDYQQATKFWTGLQDYMIEALSPSNEARNEILSTWELLGGRIMLIDSLYNSLNALKKLVSVVSEALTKVFPPITASRLLALTRNLRDFTKELIMSDETAEKLRRTFSGLFAVIDILYSVVSGGLNMIFELLSYALDGVGDSILDVTANAGDSIVAFRDWLKENELVTRAFKKITEVCKKVIDVVRKLIEQFVELPIVQKIFSAISDTLSDILEKIGNWLVSSDGMQEDLQKIGQKAQEVFDAIRSGAETIVNKLGLGDYFAGLGEKIGELWNGVSNFFRGDPITKIKDFIAGIKEFIQLKLDGFDQNVTTPFNKFTSAIDSVWERVKTFASSIGLTFGNITKEVGGFISNIWEGLKSFANWIQNNFLTVVIGAGVIGAALAIAKIVLSFKGIFSGLGSMLSGAGKALAGWGFFQKAKGIASVVSAVTGLVAAITALVGVIEVVAAIEPAAVDKAINVLWQLTAMIAVLISVNAILGGLGKRIGSVAGSGSSSTVNNSLLNISNNMSDIASFAIGITAMVNALQIIASIPEERAKSAMWTLTFMVGELVLASFALSKGAPQLSKGSIFLLAFGGAVKLLAGALKSISELDSGNLVQSLIILTLLIGELSLLALAARNMNAGTALSLIGISLMLKMVIGIVMDISEIPVDKAVVALGLLTSLFIGLGIFLGVISRIAPFGQDALGIGILLAGLGAGIWLIVKAMQDLGNIPKESLTGAMLAVDSIMAIMAGMVFLSKFSGENAAKAGQMLLEMGLGLVLAAAAIKILASIDDEKALLRATAAVDSIIGMMALVVLASKAAGNAKGTVTAIAGTLFIVALAIGALSFIAAEDERSLLIATACMDSLIGMLALLVGVSGQAEAANKAKGVFVVMGLIILELAYIITEMIKMPLDQAIVAAESLSLLMLAMSVSVLIVSKANNITDAAIKGIFAMGVVIGGIVLIVGLVNSIGGEIAFGLEAAAGISLLLLAMSTSIVILSKADTLTLDAIKAMDSMLIVVAGLMGVITILSSIAGEGGIQLSIETAASIGILLNLMSTALLILSYAKEGIEDKISALGAMTLVVAGLMLIVAELAGHGMHVELGISTAIAIGILINLMSTALMLLSTIKEVSASAMVALGVMTLSVAALMAVIGILEANGMHVQLGIGTAIAIGILLNAMSAALLILAMVGPVAIEAIVGIAVLDILIADLVLVVAAIGSAFNEINGLEESFKKGIEVLIMLADGIGRAIGAFIIGGINQIVDSLPNIGTKLSQFAENIKPFIETFKIDIDQALIDSLLHLSAAILVLSAAEFLGGISALLGFGSMASIGSVLGELGPALKQFSDDTDGIKPGNLLACSIAAEHLASMMEKLPRSGGWVGTILGDRDFDSFVESIGPFGQSMKSFSNGVQGIDAEAVKAAAEAGGYLADLAQNMVSRGGKLQELIGEKETLAEFGETFPPFGKALKTFSSNIEGIDAEAVSSAADAAMHLADLANNLRAHDGILQTLIGDASLSTFAKEMYPFGNALVYFSGCGERLNIEGYEKMVTAGEKINELAQNLGTENGWVQKVFGGDMNLEDFGEHLNAYGTYLADFSTSVKDIDFGKVYATKNATDCIVEVAKQLVDDAIVVNFETFGNVLSIFGSNFFTYFEYIKTIQYSKISSTTKGLAELIAAFKDLNGFDSNTIGLFAENIGKLADSGIESFCSSFQNALDDARTAAEDFLNAFIEAAEEKGSALNTSCDTIMTEALKMISLRNTDWYNAGKNIISKLKSGVDAEGQSFITKVANKVDEARYEIIGKNLSFQNAGAGLMNQLKVGLDVNPSFAEKCGAIVSSAVSTISGYEKDIYNAGGKLVERFNAGMSEYAVSPSSTASSVFGGALDSASNVAAAAAEAASAASDEYGSFYDAGAYLMIGLARGLADYSGRVVDQASVTTRAAANVFVRGWRINSPSKLAEEYGMYFDLGLANGFDKYRYAVINSAEGMSSDTIDVVGSTISKISSVISSNDEIVPTITPILDLSEIQNGVNDVYGMFGTDAAINGSGLIASSVARGFSSTQQMSALDELKSQLNAMAQAQQPIQTFNNTFNITGDNAEELAEQLSSILQQQLERSGAVWA